MPENHVPNTQTLSLENERLLAVFDARSGALLRLVNKNTDWEIHGRANLARSFCLVVPLPERLLNIIEDVDQSPAAVTHSADRLTFEWQSLTSEHGGLLDIRLKNTVTLESSGLTFEMEIDNRSPYPVESAAYPIIGDLTRPATSDTLRRAHLMYCNLNFKSLYPTFDNERGYWGVEYPIQMIPSPESPFVLILGEDEGLYVGCHDTTSKERTEFTFQLKPGQGRVGRVPAQAELAGRPVHIECMTTHFPFVQPGESYQLAPIVFKPFEGDWHSGVDLYKTWRQTWMNRPSSPAWVEDIHSWQQIQMTSWGDTLQISYKDLVEYGRECVRHGVGAIQLTGWTLYGQDGRLPIHEIDPRLGTWEELRDAIKQIQGMGVKIILYEKYTCTDKATDWYQNELHRYASKDVFGHTHGHEGWRYDTPAHLAGINTRPYAWMCMNSPDWHEIALDQIRKSLELHPAGILLDECQWHGANAFYCFDPSHGHRVPSYNFGGDGLFEEKLRDLLDQVNPELVLAGEGTYDLQNRQYTLAYHRTFLQHVPGMRYIDSFMPLMNWAYGYDDREAINICLLYRYIISYEPRHFRGHLEEFPLTLEYGKKVDALRRRYRQYLWDAEFRDTQGARVTVDGRLHTPYSVFQSTKSEGRAVVLVNHSDEEITTSIEFEDKPDECFVISPENPERQLTEGTVFVPARSAVVVLSSADDGRHDS